MTGEIRKRQGITGDLEKSGNNRPNSGSIGQSLVAELCKEDFLKKNIKDPYVLYTFFIENCQKYPFLTNTVI